MSVKITCIVKDHGNHENPYVAIKSMNRLNEQNQEQGTSSREQVYDFITNGGIAYVKDASGHQSQLVGWVSPAGTKYVKTTADHVIIDNLLQLPEYKRS